MKEIHKVVGGDGTLRGVISDSCLLSLMHLASVEKNPPLPFPPHGGGAGVGVADCGHFARVFIRRSETRFMTTWRGTLLSMEKSLDPLSGFDYRVARFQPRAAHRLHAGKVHPHSLRRQLRPGNDVGLAGASPRKGSASRDMTLVTAGIITDAGRVLICQRRAGTRFGLKWEFPGGKVEDGESPEASLRRELLEELSVEAEVGPEIYRVVHQYPNGVAVRLVFFRVLRYAGAPVNLAFERMLWVQPDELAGYDFLEADRELVERMARGEIR
jgi:8-oxo-dGTP diphosphatase